MTRSAAIMKFLPKNYLLCETKDNSDHNDSQNRIYFFQHIKNYRTAGSFGMYTLERKIKAFKTQNVSENCTAQIKFPIFLRHAKTCNENVGRNLGDGIKNKRNEHMEKLTKLVKKRSNSFCDGQKP